MAIPSVYQLNPCRYLHSLSSQFIQPIHNYNQTKCQTHSTNLRYRTSTHSMCRMPTPSPYHWHNPTIPSAPDSAVMLLGQSTSSCPPLPTPACYVPALLFQFGQIQQTSPHATLRLPVQHIKAPMLLHHQCCQDGEWEYGQTAGHQRNGTIFGQYVLNYC